VRTSGGLADYLVTFNVPDSLALRMEESDRRTDVDWQLAWCLRRSPMEVGSQGDGEEE
jgi:hypothetical protein